MPSFSLSGTAQVAGVVKADICEKQSILSLENSAVEVSLRPLPPGTGLTAPRCSRRSPRRASGRVPLKADQGPVHVLGAAMISFFPPPTRSHQGGKKITGKAEPW